MVRTQGRERDRRSIACLAERWLAGVGEIARVFEGQRELVCDSHRLTGLERRFLSSVTGHTPLRVLLDLGLQAPGISDAIIRLVDMKMIEPGD